MAHLLTQPRPKFYDTAGNVLAGGKIYTYAAGSTTPLATYTDKTELAANTNPVVLDPYGEANIWLGAGSYKIVVTSAAGATIRTVDAVSQVNDLAIATGLIADLAVTTSKIADLTVTTAKFDASAVTAGKLAAKSIVSSKFNDLAVTTAKLNDLAISTSKLANGAVTAAKIDADFINDYSTVSPELGDYLLIGDTSDSNNVKKALVSTLPIDNSKRLMRYIKNVGATTATNLGFPAAPTLSGSLTGASDAFGDWLAHITGTSDGDATGTISTTFTFVQPRWLPEFYANVRMTSFSNSNFHAYAGFVSANADASDLTTDGAAWPALAVACFAMRGSLSGGSNNDEFVCVTSTGTSGSGNFTQTNTGISCQQVAANLKIVFVSTSQVDFYIDDVRVASHTTDLPNSNQGLGMGIRITKTGSADGFTRKIEWRRIEVRHI